LILTEVPERCPHRLRRSPVATQHARQPPEQQRPARVLQLTEGHFTSAATKVAETRMAQQP
jgi:hypothetical protein